MARPAQEWQSFEPRKKQLVSTFEQHESDCDLDLDSDNEEQKNPIASRGLDSIHK